MLKWFNSDESQKDATRQAKEWMKEHKDVEIKVKYWGYGGGNGGWHYHYGVEYEDN